MKNTPTEKKWVDAPKTFPNKKSQDACNEKSNQQKIKHPNCGYHRHSLTEEQQAKMLRVDAPKKFIQAKIPQDASSGKQIQQKRENPTSRYRNILLRQSRRGQLPKHHFPKRNSVPLTLLALIMNINIRTCAAHGMRLQAEGKREPTPTDAKGPNLWKKTKPEQKTCV